MVTHLSAFVGSMTNSQTVSGGASMSIEVWTELIEVRERTSAGGERLARRFPLAQRALDGGVEVVQADAEELGRARVAREEVARQALHERADELRRLAADGGRDLRRERAAAEAQAQRRAPDQHQV